MLNLWRTIMRAIETEKLIENINLMINSLEYDSMRSPGKLKVNSDTLANLFYLKERYEKIAVEAPTVEEAVVEAPAKKTTAKKSAVAKA